MKKPRGRSRERIKTLITNIVAEKNSECSRITVFPFPHFLCVKSRGGLQSADLFAFRSDMSVTLQWHHPGYQLHLHFLKAVHDLLLVTGKSHAKPSQIPAWREHTLGVCIDSTGSTPQPFTRPEHTCRRP